MSAARLRVATWLMELCYRMVERVDRRAVPKMTPWAFTFEIRQGVVFNDTGCSSERRGCRLAYLDDNEYERAFTDSNTMSHNKGAGL